MRPNSSYLRRLLWLAVMIPAVLPGSAQQDPYLAGRACMQQELYDSAAFLLEQALGQHPGETDILYQLGLSYFATRNYTAARDAFYEAERRRSGIASFYLAKTEMKLNHPEQALKYLRVNLTSRYKEPENVILLDEDLSRLEGKPGWIELWQERNWYSAGDKRMQEASFLVTQGNRLEAINILNQLEKQGYNRSQVQTMKAAIYMELDNMKAATSELTSAVKSDVRNLDALQQLAQIQVEEGDAEEAAEALSRVIRQDPARFSAYLQRAEARSLEGDLAGALEDMELYLAYFPQETDAIFRKGMIQYNHGRYLDAIQSFNRVLRLDSGEAAYFFARGRTYAATGTIRYADRDMSMALDLDPENGSIWFEKGKLSEKLGDMLEACHCYTKAFQYGVFEAGEILEMRCR